MPLALSVQTIERLQRGRQAMEKRGCAPVGTMKDAVTMTACLHRWTFKVPNLDCKDMGHISAFDTLQMSRPSVDRPH